MTTCVLSGLVGGGEKRLRRLIRHALNKHDA